VGATSATARDTQDVTDRGHRDRVDVHHDHRPGDADAHRAQAYDREEARARYGGVKWGAAFFGWLSANGLNVLLLALAGAAGAAFGLTQSSEARSNAGTIGIAGGILLLVILGLGYVAGRMSRFDGARQGLAVWLIGLLVTVALAVAGVIFGAEYNVLSQLELPRIPVDEGSTTAGSLIALALVLLVTLVAAVLGGRSGERYHRKIDRVATHS